jgi:hypothetical protein
VNGPPLPTGARELAKNVCNHKRKHEVLADQVNDIYDIPLEVAEKRQLGAEVGDFRGTYLVIKRDGVFIDLTYQVYRKREPRLNTHTQMTRTDTWCQKSATFCQPRFTDNSPVLPVSYWG